MQTVQNGDYQGLAWEGSIKVTYVQRTKYFQKTVWILWGYD